MQKIKMILITAGLMLFAFSAIIYTSCKKNPCSGVTCQNGGSCSGGNCNCPTGYSGNFCENSSIVYENDTYTPISITVGNSTATIAVGGSVTYVGSAGSTATVSAYTSGATTSGTIVGDTYTWAFTDNFPTGGAGLSESLDVDASYFYLKMQNNNASQSVVSIKVNYGSSSQTTDNVAVPNDGAVYGIGYYLAYANTEIYAASSVTGSYWTWYPAIPNTANASVTMQIP